MNKILIFLSLFIICVANFSYADEIFIESEELIITRAPLTTTFVGNVYAFDNQIKLWSDKVTIHYTGNDNQIDKIKAYGNTKLIRKNEEILSKSIVYEVIEQKILAVGNVILTQGKNIMNGDELNIDLVDSTSIMKSINKNRVKVKINTDNEPE